MSLHTVAFPCAIASMLGPSRRLSNREIRLVLLLLEDSRAAFAHRIRSLRAFELDYMGGLLFDQSANVADGKLLEEATFTCTLAQARFLDRDGTPIDVRLDGDQFGKLYALDLHKPNFESLIEYPSRRSLQARIGVSAALGHCG